MRLWNSFLFLWYIFLEIDSDADFHELDQMPSFIYLISHYWVPTVRANWISNLNNSYLGCKNSFRIEYIISLTFSRCFRLTEPKKLLCVYFKNFTFYVFVTLFGETKERWKLSTKCRYPKTHEILHVSPVVWCPSAGTHWPGMRLLWQESCIWLQQVLRDVLEGDFSQVIMGRFLNAKTGNEHFLV